MAIEILACVNYGRTENLMCHDVTVHSLKVIVLPFVCQ